MSAKQRRRRALEAQSEWTPTLIEAYDREMPERVKATLY